MKQAISSPIPAFLGEAGQMKDLFVKTNWDRHPLGPPESWPPFLQTAAGICMNSPLSMAVFWGQDSYILYNDAWAPIAGDLHPRLFARPGRNTDMAALNEITAACCEVMRTGTGLLRESVPMPMLRRGFTEECYVDYTCYPVYGSSGEIAGVLNVCRDTTQSVVAGRRRETIRKLSEKTIIAESPEAACILLANTLTEAPADIPFALFYLLNPDKSSLRLTATSSVDPGTSIADESVSLRGKTHRIRYKAALRTATPQLHNNLDRYYELPGGIWDEPASRAVVLPIIQPRTKELYGAVTLGISPRLIYDREYETFVRQIAEQAAFAIGNAYELSRRLSLEAREHDTREQLNSALSIGSIGVWLWDLPTDTVIVDKNLAKRLGVNERKARLGLPFTKFIENIHPDDRAFVRGKLNTSVRLKKGFEAEFRFQARDGSVRWVIARGRVEPGRKGQPARLPGVIVDITRRKEAERKLASSQLIFKALFESSIIGVAVSSTDNTIKEANSTFLKLFDYTRKDVANGLTWDMLIPASSRKQADNDFKGLLAKGEIEPNEIEFARKDKTLVPVLAGAVMVPGSKNTFISFILDISEQRHLAALNKAKDEFISIASHQLRTPATGVKQYLGMVLEGYAGKITSVQQDIIKTAYDSNERQLTIVNDLLRIAQAEAESIKLAPSVVDLSGLISDVIHEQTYVFASKQQHIQFNVQKDMPAAVLDLFHMRMVFDNLIDNASKYTPPGKNVTIELRSLRGKICISIKDEGVGIRKRDMGKLFKKFSRIDNPLSTPGGGTGLGLYWVMKIIEAHNGTIEARSEYRKGTEFIITLPADITKV